MKPIRIRRTDRARHEAFFRYAPQIFPAVDFRRWAARDGWHDSYEILALAEGGELVAAIGRTRMAFTIDGRETIGYQLGAVGTLPRQRGRGHARRLMQWVIDELEAPDQPVVLFANETVLDFYPRFGFRRVMQQNFGASLDLAPSGPRARPVDLDDAADRTRLARLCALAPATGRGFSARDYYGVLLWHLTYRPLAAHWVEGVEAVVVTAEAEGELTLHDVIAAVPFDLRAALPRAIGSRIDRITFGFEPAAWWPEAAATGDDPEALLFVRGGPPPPAAPFRFPDLAQT